MSSSHQFWMVHLLADALTELQGCRSQGQSVLQRGGHDICKLMIACAFVISAVCLRKDFGQEEGAHTSYTISNMAQGAAKKVWKVKRGLAHHANEDMHLQQGVSIPRKP